MNQFSTLAFVPIFWGEVLVGKLEITQQPGCPALPTCPRPGAPVPGAGGHRVPSKEAPQVWGSPCTPQDSLT